MKKLCDRVYLGPDYNYYTGDICIEDDVILSVIPKEKSEPKQALLPPFVDVHIHGSYGIDCMNASDSDLVMLAKRLRENGVGGFLPTAVASDRDSILKLAESVGKCKDKSVLGIHIEGPFLSREYKGIMDERYILPCDNTLFDDVKSYAKDKVIRFTVAPESEGSEGFCKYVCKNGGYVSMGHSGADNEQCRTLSKRGANSYTHLFNAMAPLHHRLGGILSEALSDELYCELIADGVHVNKEALNIAYKCKKEKLVLISDAFEGAGEEKGTYSFCGKMIYVSNGKAADINGRLAASVGELKKNVLNMASICGFETAVKFASENPARVIGKFEKIGSIEEGKLLFV